MYCRGEHQAEFTPGSGARKAGRPCERLRVEQAVDAPLGDGADFAGRDRQVIAGEGQDLAVEVAVRLDPLVAQDGRVVDGRAQLAAGDRAGEGERIARGAGDLRMAAQRVGSWTAWLESRCEAVMAESPSRRRKLAAEATWPGCGRSA